MLSQAMASQSSWNMSQSLNIHKSITYSSKGEAYEKKTHVWNHPLVCGYDMVWPPSALPSLNPSPCYHLGVAGRTEALAIWLVFGRPAEGISALVHIEEGFTFPPHKRSSFQPLYFHVIFDFWSFLGGFSCWTTGGLTSPTLSLYFTQIHEWISPQSWSNQHHQPFFN